MMRTPGGNKRARRGRSNITPKAAAPKGAAAAPSAGALPVTPMAVFRDALEKASGTPVEVLVPSPPPGHRPRGDLQDPDSIPAEDTSFTPQEKYLEVARVVRNQVPALEGGLGTVMVNGGGSYLDVVQAAQSGAQRELAKAEGSCALFQAILMCMAPAQASVVARVGAVPPPGPNHFAAATNLALALVDAGRKQLDVAKTRCVEVEDQAIKYLYEPGQMQDGGPGEGEEEEEEGDEEEDDDGDEGWEQGEEEGQEQEDIRFEADLPAFAQGSALEQRVASMRARKLDLEQGPGPRPLQLHPLRSQPPRLPQQGGTPPPAYQPPAMSQALTEAQIQQMRSLLGMIETAMQSSAAAGSVQAPQPGSKGGAKGEEGKGEGEGGEEDDGVPAPVATPKYVQRGAGAVGGKRRIGSRSSTGKSPSSQHDQARTRSRAKSGSSTGDSVAIERPKSSAARTFMSPPREGQKYPFYGIAIGREVKVSDSWAETKKLVDGYPGNKYKGFKSHEEAAGFVAAFRRP